MLSGRMRDRLRVARTITDGTVTDHPEGPWFPATIGPLEAQDGELPRQRLRRELTIAARVLTHACPLLTAGARLAARDGTVYELLDDMGEVTHARRLIAYTTVALAVDELYPLSATITGQDGTVLAEDARVAIAPVGERNDARGTYEDFRGEAPLDHHDQLNARNRSLLVGGVRYRMVTCVRRPAFVELELRVAGG